MGRSTIQLSAEPGRKLRLTQRSAYRTVEFYNTLLYITYFIHMLYITNCEPLIHNWSRYSHTDSNQIWSCGPMRKMSAEARLDIQAQGYLQLMPESMNQEGGENWNRTVADFTEKLGVEFWIIYTQFWIYIHNSQGGEGDLRINSTIWTFWTL